MDEYGDVPDAEALGRQAVVGRSEALADPDEERYFADDEAVVSELLAVHGERASVEADGTGAGGG